MPVVPFTPRPGQSQPNPRVDPTFLMIAAVDLHEAGRLVEPSGSAATVYDRAIEPKPAPKDPA